MANTRENCNLLTTIHLLDRPPVAGHRSMVHFVLSMAILALCAFSSTKAAVAQQESSVNARSAAGVEKLQRHRYPSFSVSTSPAAISLVSGGPAVSMSILATAHNGFSSTVKGSFRGLPSGVTVQPSTLTLTPVSRFRSP